MSRTRMRYIDAPLVDGRSRWWGCRHYRGETWWRHREDGPSGLIGKEGWWCLFDTVLVVVEPPHVYSVGPSGPGWY